MKKITMVTIVMLIALLGISGTAFAKHHHHRRRQQNTNANQPKNAGQATGSTVASVTGPVAGTSKTN